MTDEEKPMVWMDPGQDDDPHHTGGSNSAFMTLQATTMNGFGSGTKDGEVDVTPVFHGILVKGYTVGAGQTTTAEEILEDHSKMETKVVFFASVEDMAQLGLRMLGNYLCDERQEKILALIRDPDACSCDKIWKEKPDEDGA